MALSIFERIGNQVAQKYIPKLGVPAKLNKFVPAARSLLNGDLSGAANSLLNQLLGPMLGSSLDGTPLALSGGLTLSAARQMFQQAAATEYARKNLWLLTITNIGEGGAPDINMFATDVSYAPHTVTGDAVKVGSTHFDTVTGVERIEMRINTLDDAAGTIKRWAEDLRYRMAHRDGTFGLPIEYLVRVSVTHASIIDGESAAYTTTHVMRFGSLETDLNRREDAMQELALTLIEFDPFTTL